MTKTDCEQTQLPVPALRSQVRLTDAHTLAALAADPARVLIGLAEGDTPVTFTPQDGNLLVCTGSGGGTTAVLRALAAQSAALGADVEVLDPSPHGHPWADGLANATAIRRIEDAHELLLARAAALTATRAEDPGWTGRRVLVLENTATLVFGLRQYWYHTRPETQLREAPAVTALAQLLAAGPDRGVHTLAGNPRGDLPGLAAGTGTAFGHRLLGSVGHAVWHRAAPEVWAIPALSYHPGRLHLAADRTLTTLQALYVDHDEAHHLAAGAAR